MSQSQSPEPSTRPGRLALQVPFLLELDSWAQGRFNPLHFLFQGLSSP